MQAIHSQMTRLKNWILSTNYWKLLLIFLAKLFAKPSDYKTELQSKRSLYSALDSVAIILIASGACSSMMLSSLTIVFKAFDPSFRGFSSIVELGVFGLSIEIDTVYLVFFAAIIAFYGYWWWLLHRFVVWRSICIGRPVSPVSSTYFVLMVSNIVLWGGVIAFLSVWLQHSIVAQDLTAVRMYAESHPLQLLLLFVVITGIHHRIESIKKESAQQLYPKGVYRIVMPFAVALIPPIALIGVVNVVG